MNLLKKESLPGAEHIPLTTVYPELGWLPPEQIPDWHISFLQHGDPVVGRMFEGKQLLKN